MRAIFFNIWHGQVFDKLEKFIVEQKDGTDIFGFVEVNPQVQQKLLNILPEFNNLYNKGSFIEYKGGLFQGHSIFLNNKFKSENLYFDTLFSHVINDAGGLMAVDLLINSTKLAFGVVHGQAHPGDKQDTPSRIEQSQRILNHFEKATGPVLIGGDFNLYPETQSVQMFEAAGYRNLIKEFNITNTRNKISWGNFGTPQYFADYCFVKNLDVKNFQVPNIEASDHEPQILDFEI